jgi:hypothetical protein
MSDTKAPAVLLHGDATDGRLAVLVIGGGVRPPLHRHDFDETFYVSAR